MGLSESWMITNKDSQRKANIVFGEKSNLSDYSFEDMPLQDNVDPLYAILQQVDEDVTMDHHRSMRKPEAR